MKISDNGTIDLRNEDDEVEFRISQVDEKVSHEQTIGNVQVAAVSELEASASRVTDKVKVKFDKFVNLIATHAYDDVVEKHMDDDVIISTDLLTDLANAHEEKEDKKVSLIFVFGIILGAAIVWILFKT